MFLRHLFFVFLVGEIRVRSKCLLCCFHKMQSSCQTCFFFYKNDILSVTVCMKSRRLNKCIRWNSERYNKTQGDQGETTALFSKLALVTYFSTFPSPSLSMLSIYSFVKQKRRCCKTRFATPPFMLEVQIALEREQDYFLSQLFLSPQPCSPQQPFFSLHSFLQSFMQPFLQDFLSSFLQHFLSSFLQHFLLSFLQQVSFLSACFTSCAAALRPKARSAANARHLAAAFTLNSFMLSFFCGCWMLFVR